MRYLLLNIKFWLLGNIKKYLPFLAHKIRSTTSIITINQNKKTVIKETIRYTKYNIVENEIYWLNKLSDFIHTPNVISYNKTELTLSYSGEPLSAENIPNDWEVQINIILNKLIEINCAHNDIKPTDLLIQDGKIILIDFQWATRINEKIPLDWPRCIGREYKNNLKFDDKYSIYKSINFILGNK